MQNSLARPGVGEIKGKDHAMDKYMSLVDLMRIGLIISKGAIDSNKGILGVYVVGFQMTFYVTTLLSKGLYVLYEIYPVSMPCALQDMRSFVVIA
ncbi:hypothetical protein BCV71DRAFT_282360 [Rhizopus microsporus]|uniref:Uncharacterized protein n=1 Tax=Rhizopus microsporus TaxID=58291 RepID=A0A1X0S6J3_RHIZD|nr:hypothetical protein BCV71DRAFT_282360 [Rhizopus microsporus]